MFIRLQGMLKNIPGIFYKTPGNVSKDSGKCLKRFEEILSKILGDAQEDWALYNQVK